MITLVMAGGLGNQLFQYAALRCVADSLEEELEIDTRFYSASSARSIYGLWIDQLPIRAKLKSYSHVWLSGPHSFPTRAKRKIVETFLRPVFRERGLGYDALASQIKRNSVVYGNFQSYRYFDQFWDVLAKEFDPRGLMSCDEWSECQRIAAGGFTSIHVRRGDYLDLDGFHMVGPETYISNAMALVASSVANARFLVFSDDLDWCRRSGLFPEERCAFYSPLVDRNPVVDIFVMSQCSHHIIANSSFSWWAAYIGDKRGKMIIAPRTWIQGRPSVESGIVPPHWIAL